MKALPRFRSGDGWQIQIACGWRRYSNNTGNSISNIVFDASTRRNAAPGSVTESMLPPDTLHASGGNTRFSQSLSLQYQF
jgi:hypothetical protein